jgi:hypothetical protein
LPTASAEDLRLVFELLKGHLRLEVSAISHNRLISGYQGLADPVRSSKVVMGSSQCFYIPCSATVPSGPGSQSPEQEVVIFLTRHLFLKALSGLSKQGPMFRNSYATGHLCHGIAT